MTVSMNDAYRRLLRELVLEPTHDVAPRGRRTLERLASTLVVDLRYPALTLARRRLGYRFLPAEAAWILSGDDRVEPIARYSRRLREFSDDGETFFGAYGPRVRGQLDYVVDALERDPTTRQAVIGIWRENPPPTRDVPCTLAAQFLVREGRLHLFVTMRSSDAWLGVPYDVFSFAMLAGYVLLELDADLQLGNLYQTAASRHLYASDLDAARALLLNPTPAFRYEAFDPYAFDSAGDLVAHLWALARRDRADLRGPFLTELLDLPPKKRGAP